MANRFHNDGPPDFYVSCSGEETKSCGSRDFKLGSGRLVQLLLETATNGPVVIGRPGYSEQRLQEPVTCAKCGRPYGPQSVWDPT